MPWPPRGSMTRTGSKAAAAALAAADGSGLVLGVVVRLLLEDLHPDGIDGDDIRQTLEDCVRAASRWQPETDPHTLLVLLAGALGVHDQDEEVPPPAPNTLARHTALLIDHLLAAGQRPLSAYVEAATHGDRTHRTVRLTGARTRSPAIPGQTAACSHTRQSLAAAAGGVARPPIPLWSQSVQISYLRWVAGMPMIQSCPAAIGGGISTPDIR